MLSTEIKRNFTNKYLQNYLNTSDIKNSADYFRVISCKVTDCFKRAKIRESELMESIKKSKNVFALNFASDFYSHSCYSETKNIFFCKDVAFCFYYTNKDYERYYKYINDITTNSGIYYFICTNMMNLEHTNLLVVEKKEDGKKIFYSLDVNPLNNTLVTYNLHKESEFVLLPDDFKCYGYEDILNGFTDGILLKHGQDFRNSISEETDEKIQECYKNAIIETYHFISEQKEDISEKSFAEFLIGKGHQVRANGFFVTIKKNSDKNCVDRVIELIYTLLKDGNKENVIKLLNEATFELNKNELDKFKKAAIISNYERFKESFSDASDKINEFLQKYKFNENEEFVNDILNKKYSELFKEEILESGKSELIQKITDEENKQYLENLEYNIFESTSQPVVLSGNLKEEKVNEDEKIIDNEKTGSHQEANKEKKIINNKQTGSHKKTKLERRKGRKGKGGYGKGK